MQKQKKDKKSKANKIDPTFDKERAKLQMFDPRGIQTLFRTLSRNHYNLLKMVDNKASIVLTVNSILISLLMGAMYIAPESNRIIIATGAKILIRFSMLSMIFALFSMLPHRYIGKKFKKSGYKGSLYASNFARLSLSDFQKEFQRIMTNGETVYDEMIKDLYFLGRSVRIKQRLLIISVGVFLIGLVSMIIYTSVNGI
ncbi:MAG: Pycsar system effector family protein [Bacteroidota bacterium]